MHFHVIINLHEHVSSGQTADTDRFYNYFWIFFNPNNSGQPSTHVKVKYFLKISTYSGKVTPHAYTTIANQ